MNEFTDQLWPAFEAEVSEQLEQLEQVLARGDLDIDIHFLFRQFHTIKSSCAMMGFAGMEELAHAAEDLLDQVRKAQRTFDEALLSALLRTTDTLRQQMTAALRDRLPPAHDPALLAQLHALRDGFSAAIATPEPTPPADAASNEAADAMRPLVESYAACASATLPLLAIACAEGLPLPEILSALETTAEAAGLLAVTRILQRLHATPPESRLGPLEDLLACQHHIETLSGLDAGHAASTDILRHELRAQLLEQLRQAADLNALPLAGAADAEPWLAVLQPLRRYCHLCGLLASHRLLSLVAQALRDIARGALAPSISLRSHLLLAMSLPNELEQTGIEDPPYRELAAQLLANIQQLLRRDTTDDTLSPLLTLDLNPETQAVLTATAQQQLQAAVATGLTLVEIDADLDLAEDGGAAFVAWLTGHGTAILNHTLFRGTGSNASTLLRFLAALPLSPEKIAHALSELDPDGSVLNLRVLAAAGPAETITPSTPAESHPQAPEPAPQNSSVRIDSSTLDTFVNRVGELVMLRNTLAHQLSQATMGRTLTQLVQALSSRKLGNPEAQAELLGLARQLASQHQQAQQTDTRLQDTLGLLQEEALALRVIPVGTLFGRMSRIARSLAQAQDKQIHIEVSGDATRIDKGMVELLVEPLTHMVRNAVDHGLERSSERLQAGKTAAGSLRLNAMQQGNNVVLTIADDGRGMDFSRILAKARRLGLASERFYGEEDIVQFIFAPGFSTSEAVTAISGRGVGMDVVKTRIGQIGGQIDVRTEPGQGTEFTLRLPLSVAIQNIVLVAAGGRTQALPERYVSEILRLPASAVQSVQGQATCLLRGAVLPLYRLTQLLGQDPPAATAGELEIIVINNGRHRLGLLVDQVLGREEIFVRDVHPDILRLPGVGGASLLGDGRVVVILDVDSLFELARHNAQNLQALMSAV